MKYQKQLDKLCSGAMSRADITKLKANAEALVARGDKDALIILDNINSSKPTDSRILFMGFCPDADFNQRLDLKWKQEGICRFDFLVSKPQVDRWNTLCTGDLVVLKKREKIGKTMKIYGHGRIKKIAHDNDELRYVEMAGSSQHEVIEVPLMGCNSTVDIKTMETVEEEMPVLFWQWLNVS